jgi:DNA-binding beta-propeller fold protein YncE
MEGTRITNTIPVVVISLLLLTASCGGMGGNGSGQTPAEKLTILEIFKDGENGVDGLAGAPDVAVSSDGENVYVAGYADDALAVFDRNTDTGALSYSTLFEDGVAGVDGLAGAQDVAVSSDGKNVYVAGYADSALVVFDRDTDTGALSYSTLFEDGVAGVDGLNEVTDVAVSLDGENVYAAGMFDDALAVFNRDTDTGALSYSTLFEDGVAGVDGLDGARGVSVSPDGENVYVTGRYSIALVVFNRDTDTGALSYSTLFEDGVAGVDGLAGPCGVTVSADGENVYVGGIDGTLAVFNRDTATGALSYSTLFEDGVDGVEGLDGAIDVAVSPDGENVYVTGIDDNALVVFDRDTDTGALSYSTLFEDGIDGVDGLAGACGVTVSADGENVYATGVNENTLVVFDR